MSPSVHVYLNLAPRPPALLCLFVIPVSIKLNIVLWRSKVLEVNKEVLTSDHYAVSAYQPSLYSVCGRARRIDRVVCALLRRQRNEQSSHALKKVSVPGQSPRYPQMAYPSELQPVQLRTTEHMTTLQWAPEQVPGVWLFTLSFLPPTARDYTCTTLAWVYASATFSFNLISCITTRVRPTRVCHTLCSPNHWDCR